MRIYDGMLCSVDDEDLNADGLFVVPDIITKIGYAAFRKCYKLTSVTIDRNVMDIGSYAFDGCLSLTSVTIGDSVTSIGNGAFYDCTSLKSITIPNSVTYIGTEAFYNCSGLISQKENYKAFRLTPDGELMCRNTTYALGKRSFVEGKLELCKNGIHYCTNLFDIFTYYSGEYGKDFVIAECEVSDKNLGTDNDSKRCAEWVKPTRILLREEVIKIMNGD